MSRQLCQPCSGQSGKSDEDSSSRKTFDHHHHHHHNYHHHNHWKHFNGYGRRNHHHKFGKNQGNGSKHRSDNSNWRSSAGRDEATASNNNGESGLKEVLREVLRQETGLKISGQKKVNKVNNDDKEWGHLLPAEVVLKIGAYLDEVSLESLKKASRSFEAALMAGQGCKGIEQLPTEVLTHLCSFLGEPDLATLMRVSWRLKAVVSSDYVWASKAGDCLVTNNRCPAFASRTAPVPLETALERLRVSRNWTSGTYQEARLAVHDTRYMPKLQLERHSLWVSWGNKIWSHPRRPDGTVDRKTNRVLKSHTVDVSQFVVKDGFLVSGGRDGTLVGWDSGNGEFLFAKRHCHGSDVSALDVVGSSGVIVTGSRDKKVKIWALKSHQGDHCNDQGGGRMPSGFPSCQCLTTMDFGDRIWSLAVNPPGDKLAVGTAGLMGIPCLRVVDLTELHGPSLPRGCRELGQNLKNGAGMLDIHWLCPSTFLSCGYDTCARLWDIRTETYVRSWEEPFDAAVYCMATDGNMSLICGTARHGLVRLWDMRQTQPVQMFYTKHAFYGRSSPVYSVAFDQKHLYVALDQCLNLLSFAGGLIET